MIESAIRSFRSTFSGLADSSADRPDAIVEDVSKCDP